MTTNEYLIKRILELESANEELNDQNVKLRKTIDFVRDSQAKQQRLINKVSDEIKLVNVTKDKVVMLQASSVFDKDLYDVCFELFDLEWREKV